MQEHCRRAHGWQNTRGRGRPSKQGPQHQAPWTNGVHCRRFFKGRHASGWFEVESGGLGEQAEDTDEQRVERIAAQQARRFQKAHEAEVKEAGQKDEPNLWLRRVG